jgi:MoaA/NifB/PqqE/SkfB family radical SAM enzyme
MYEVIVAPYLGSYVLLRPGCGFGAQLPTRKYQELAGAEPSEWCPDWLVAAARSALGADLAHRRIGDAVLVREESPYGYARASYELNLGCNWECEHCYLGLKEFAGLDWPDRERLLGVFRDAGVLWLQMTGGEPTIDRLFRQTYETAWRMGMMLHISSNGSRLHYPPVLDLLTRLRPYRITVSIYGATAGTYDALVRRPGAFKLFWRGMAAAREAGLPLKISVVITRTNAHEEAAMIGLAENWGLPYVVYANLSPTICGGSEVLPAQSRDHLRERRPFGGCNAGHTFFHADPHGLASICKVGRDHQVDLLAEGVEGLRKRGAIADQLMLRTGGCSGCQISGSCTVCRPLAKLYQQAKAPLVSYCQHGRRQP